MWFLLYACTTNDTINSSYHGVTNGLDLTFTDLDTQDEVLVEHRAGAPGAISSLLVGHAYSLHISFIGEAVDGKLGELNDDVWNEADTHQVFFLGEQVSSPATQVEEGLISQEYADEDANGRPVGLDSLIQAERAGEGNLRLVLRHMPVDSGYSAKQDDTAELVAAEGLDAALGYNEFDGQLVLLVED